MPVWHASVAIHERVRRKGYRTTYRPVPLAQAHPDELAIAEGVARRLLEGVGQSPDAVGSELASFAVHRRRRLTDAEMAMLSAEFMASEGAPACPAMSFEDC